MSWTVGFVLERGRITGKASSLPCPQTECGYSRKLEGNRRIPADTDVAQHAEVGRELQRLES